MNDPHVESLTYELVTSDSLRFNDPPKIIRTFEFFSITMEDNTLEVAMVEHFPTEELARQVVEPFLRAWEIDVCLRERHDAFNFIFKTSKIIDRSPSNDNKSSGVFNIKGGSVLVMGGKVKATVIRAEYPSPPDNFVNSNDVELMWERFKQYKNGLESLESMAYFCQTVLETSTKGRKNASRTYNIEDKVFSQLARFVSTRGDGMTARKKTKETSFIPLTPTEKIWIEAAIKALIRRAGEYAAEDVGEKITMRSLPDLD